ncbi:hypothetical protein BDR07DRAFT_1402096, partial [Suillus spraguei]
MYTAILLSSQLTMLIPYGDAMMIRPSPPPTDGQNIYKTCWSSAGCPTISCLILIILKVPLFNKEEQRGILQQRFPRARYWFNMLLTHSFIHVVENMPPRQIL